MKIVKRIVIIFLAVVLAIFLLLLVTPVLFKGKILEIAKRELNNRLTAEVDFSDLKLSFIRNFPSAYIALEELTVTGTGDFEGDMLAAFKRLSVTVDLLSVIKMSNIQVKSVLLDEAVVFAYVLEDGRANWDIVRSSEEAATGEAPPEEKPADGAKEGAPAAALKVALKKFEIRDAGIVFRDDSNGMEASIEDLDFVLSGDMSLEKADLNMKLDTLGINFRMGGIRLLNNASAGLVSQVAADMKNMEFTLKDNRFNLNEIILKFSGSVGMPSDGINMNLSFATERTDFKSLLSLVPAVYMKDFESITTTGSLTLAGDVKGTFNDEQMPSANINLIVDNAMFKYPDLPKSVDNINIAARASYDGVVFDRTTVDVDRFNFVMAGNPFNAELHAKTPESDLEVAARLAGKIDLDSLADIVPLDDITLKGLLECGLTLAGRMSTIEKEQYEDFNAEGMLKLSGFDFNSPDFPQAVKIKNILLNFTPRRVNLADFDAVFGRSDLVMNGTLENFIPFVFKGDTVRGSLNLKSNTIDLNEFLAGDEPKETAEKSEDAEALSVIEVPKNIDFSVNVNIGRILFDKLDIANTAGRLLVRDGKLQMQNLGMNLLDGSMVLNGEYNTEDIKLPSIDFGLALSQFDIPSALSAFSILEKILPNPQNYTGKVSANLTLSSVLGEGFSPDLNSVASKGRLQTQNVKIENSPIFGAMADLLRNESWRTPSPGNLNIGYEIRDGRLIIEPVTMNIAQSRLELSGEQGLDMSLDYKLSVAVPTSTIGSAATDLLGKIPGGSSVRELRVAGLVGGTASKPNVRLDVADMAGNVVAAVREQVTERVEEAVGQVREDINKQIDAIMAEAERQSENILSTARQAASRTRSEANAGADRLEREAASRSIIEQRLAKTAADKLRSEGEASAVKIEQEAENQAAAIMDAARKRVAELR